MHTRFKKYTPKHHITYNKFTYNNFAENNSLHKNLSKFSPNALKKPVRFFVDRVQRKTLRASGPQVSKQPPIVRNFQTNPDNTIKRLRKSSSATGRPFAQDVTSETMLAERETFGLRTRRMWGQTRKVWVRFLLKGNALATSSAPEIKQCFYERNLSPFVPRDDVALIHDNSPTKRTRSCIIQEFFLNNYILIFTRIF